MNPTLILLVIATIAAFSFLLGGSGARSWLLLLAALIVSGLGVGGVYMVEKGPQRLFAHFPLSATTVAWLGSGLALAGLGAVAGLLARACVKAKKQPTPNASSKFTTEN